METQDSYHGQGDTLLMPIFSQIKSVQALQSYLFKDYSTLSRFYTSFGPFVL
jgi:hypothetical protein